MTGINLSMNQKTTPIDAKITDIANRRIRLAI